MKRKNLNAVPADLSEEESSDDEKQQLTDDDLESNGVEEESVVEEAQESGDDLDASATESDEDESDIESELEDEKEEAVPQKSKSERIKDDILQRYQERQGKQLCIRFPHKVPETLEALEKKVKELTPLVVKVHKPRQRHVRFCLVDFATSEHRDCAFKELKKSIKKGELEKYVVNIPRTESSDFVNDLIERKLKSIENKKAKQRLKKASKKSLKENNFTSTVIVSNLPKTASLVQIRELFPNAVDVNIKPGRGKLNKYKSIAAITLPSTKDARDTIKKKVSLGGNSLIIKFDNQKLKKKLKSKNNNKPKKEDNKEHVSNEESEPKIKKAKITAEDTTDKTLVNKRAMKKNNAKNFKNKSKVGKK